MQEWGGVIMAWVDYKVGEIVYNLKSAEKYGILVPYRITKVNEYSFRMVCLNNNAFIAAEEESSAVHSWRKTSNYQHKIDYINSSLHSWNIKGNYINKTQLIRRLKKEKDKYLYRLEKYKTLLPQLEEK